MAASAVGAELAAMLVLMAPRAALRESQEAAVQILDLNAGSPARRNLLRVMALLAARGRVLPGQRKACLAMIQCLAVRLPADELKIRSVMFGVAADAILARRVSARPHGMHAATLRKPVPDFRVTFQALQLNAAPAQVVALGAVEHPGKGLVRPR